MTEQKIADALKGIRGIEAVVLGGSRATSSDHPGSDLDIGVYYRKDALDLEGLNRVAQKLDDAHRENLVCPEGGWGPWVNAGGWLTVDNLPTDLILRDVERVKNVIDETDAGRVYANYQTGHPHAFLNVMYRGELAVCRPLWTSGAEFDALKARAEVYSEAMRKGILNSFGFEMGFSAMLARKALPTGDRSYVAGHFYRSVSAMNQVLFALNRTYCLNEKRAALRVESLSRHPEDYARRIGNVFDFPAEQAADALDALAAEVRTMMEE